MIITSSSLLPSFIKMRWNEPYVSAGLNRKTFKSTPRGVYSGFVVKPGPTSYEITVAHDDPEGYGIVSGFAGGNFDAASGWSVAVHESLQGFNTTVAILFDGSNNFNFDLSGVKGQTVYVALHVDYKSGLDTVADIRIAEAVDLEADPTLINLARIDVPLVGGIQASNIIVDDPSYPRVLPFANRFKYGLMDKYQAQVLEELQQVSGTPSFVYETVLTVDGPQTVSLPPLAIYTVAGDDLWVHRNGRLMGVGRDYIEVDRGDGYGEQIDFTIDVKAGDIISFRIQKYASALTSRTKVLDEGAQISDNVVFLNFSGTGVSVLPDGPSRVKVVIPGGGGSSAVTTKVNQSGGTLQVFRAVTLLSDNTIKYFDPTVSGESLYGLTIQTIPNTAAGDIQVLGICAGAAAAVSGAIIGGDCYVSHAGDGSLTPIPPDPMAGQVIRVGLFDGGNNLVTSSAVDILIDKERIA